MSSEAQHTSIPLSNPEQDGHWNPGEGFNPQSHLGSCTKFQSSSCLHSSSLPAIYKIFHPYTSSFTFSSHCVSLLPFSFSLSLTKLELSHKRSWYCNSFSLILEQCNQVFLKCQRIRRLVSGKWLGGSVFIAVIGDAAVATANFGKMEVMIERMQMEKFSWHFWSMLV